MRVSKLNNKDRFVLVNPNYYKIDWNKSGDSGLEIQFRNLVKPFWEHDLVIFQFRIPGSLLRVDFMNLTKKIAAEISGEQHFSYNQHFHKSRAGFLSSIKRDFAKEEWIAREKYQFLELIQEDLDNFSLDYIKEKFGVSLI